MHTQPDVPLEVPCLNPDKLDGQNAGAIEKQAVMHGNEKVSIGDFFKVTGDANGELRIEGTLDRVKYIGAGLSSGRIHVTGNVGEHIGSAMSGGEIIVDGNAGDWVAPEMSGGRVIIRGDAGHLAGSAHRGSSSGITGGEIFIHGNCRNETGHAMRNGLIVIGGNSGDFTGVNMLAGTILVLGQPGIRSGAGMKRGSIVSMQEAEMLPTFTYACNYRPDWLRVLLLYLKSQKFAIPDESLAAQYQRWTGDAVELNKGEILLLNRA
ncbi:MAG: formylmethanofuran dehydrogenase subunit C [Thiotrichales bacterium]|nr:formylmethanofuran dehydrogenase subunit C [Thiotrichales bacterium]